MGGSQGGCEQRIEVFVKKMGGGQQGGREGSGWGGGVRVNVIEKLKFLGKFTQKKFRGGGGSVCVCVCVGWVVRVGGGQGECE